MSLDSFTTEFISGALNYSRERIYVLEAMLSMNSQEKELCKSIRYVLNSASVILDKERKDDSATSH